MKKGSKKGERAEIEYTYIYIYIYKSWKKRVSE